ncbi:hypothetical protein [Flavobacterium sp. KACC 22763]|uniref:hypothetical protein n=1 Tax=Flavobacterium sp. KACC 22763 TaxID=3025668 RepID=UPI0023652B5B|nr:hypothetical protein [Flavobacterium sp. KACC 22763]WDF64334.1 hypothetical protein PQ463_22290 [Flavobacterium sp. KACC 22763]
MEKLRIELSNILSKYKAKYEQEKKSKNGFKIHQDMINIYSKLKEELVDEVVSKSNEYIDEIQKEDRILLSKETILKFNII